MLDTGPYTKALEVSDVLLLLFCFHTLSSIFDLPVFSSSLLQYLMNHILQFACDVKAEIVGKPAPAFFLAALEIIHVLPEHVSSAIVAIGHFHSL